MMLLRAALTEFLTNWRADLSSAWGTVLADVDPAFADVRADLTFSAEQPIYPSRPASPLPGARPDAHVFRAFDATKPEDIRCVLVGQDPYPQISRATGRSFEQGDLAGWDQSGVANSLKRLLQMLANERTASTRFTAPNGWNALRSAIASGELDFGTPRELFDRLQEQEGLLFLNASLTITRYMQGGAPEQLFGHIPLWSPIIGKVLSTLAQRTTGHVVFLLLGSPAQRVADKVRIREIAEQTGVWGTRVDEVRLSHPASNNFLTGPNPFHEVNARLAHMGAAPIWW
jgi:uracil-DNA glycosylase